MELLHAKGAIIAYGDPFVPSFPRMRQHSFDLSSERLDEKTLKSAGCVVLVTDRGAFDCALIARHADLLADCRARYREERANLVRA